MGLNTILHDIIMQLSPKENKHNKTLQHTLVQVSLLYQKLRNPKHFDVSGESLPLLYYPLPYI